MERLFEKWAGEPCTTRNQLTASGSNRVYYRLAGATHTCIAAVNQDVRENEAFFFFAREMRQRGIRVPEVYAVSDDRRTYLQEDLGNVTVFASLQSRKVSGIDITVPMRQLYRQAIDELIHIQDSCSDIDFSHAYPRPAFDRQAMLWDLDYFKYYFLRLFHIPFDEQLLQQDYNTFIDYLLDDDCSFFMYRDFQSRNIMVVDDKLYFIDFQGARQGAPQYDLASLLYSSKADMPDTMRAQMLNYYLDQRTLQNPSFDRERFADKYYAYVYMRMLQAMGAYGFRGVIEKKDHFVKSIPLAVNNLRNLLCSHPLPVALPHLTQVLQSIVDLPEYQDNTDVLTVSVFSFSYKRGIPYDKTGNGGGFVFDCRALPNPGRLEEYREMTGRDLAVAKWLENYQETARFLDHAKGLVGAAVENYLERGFNRLMVNFGCTGGRHRSVYCAEQLAKFLRQNYDCKVVLHHIEQSRL